MLHTNKVMTILHNIQENLVQLIWENLKKQNYAKLLIKYMKCLLKK
jgi:hypothetical protein